MTSALPADACRWRADIRSQRPVVPQQQDQGQHDDLRFAHQPQDETARHHQVAALARPGGIPAISAQGQQAEQGAQQGLAFGDPGHGLDIEGVEREQGRHHKAAPCISRGPLQYPEQQHRIQGVEKHVLIVMAGRIQAEHLDVEGVRDPGRAGASWRHIRGETPRLPCSGSGRSGCAGSRLRIWGHRGRRRDAGVPGNKWRRSRGRAKGQAQPCAGTNRCEKNCGGKQLSLEAERRWKPQISLFATSISDQQWRKAVLPVWRRSLSSFWESAQEPLCASCWRGRVQCIVRLGR